MTGFVCRVCNRFIPSEEDTQVHCRTLTHYNNYCNVVRAKVSINFTSEEKLIYVQTKYTKSNFICYKTDSFWSSIRLKTDNLY